MKELYTRIEINSSAAIVWGVLTDLKNYPAWNPFIPAAEGDLTPGATLRIKIKPPGREAQPYRVKILEIAPQKEFRWLGHFHVPGLIDGEHLFELNAIGPNKTELVQREYFRGLLVPLTWSSFLNTHLREGFEALNRSLKTVAERAAQDQR